MTGRRVHLGALTTALAFGTATLVGCQANAPAAAARVRADTTCSATPDLGTGFVIDSGLILTSAHVVAGQTSIEVTIDGRADDATLVAFDPNNDLAYLEPNTPLASPAAVPLGWPLATAEELDHIERGAAASVYVERDGALTRLDAVIVRRVEIETEDIYIDADVTRPGWELGYPIQPGDSGAAVVQNGRVIGVIWARSRIADDRAYAIDPVRGGALLQRQLDAGLGVDPAVDPTRC